MNGLIEAKFTAARDVDTITAEIVTITRQTQTIILHSAIEVGRRLCEVKERIPHGEWGDYLRDRVDFSPSSANNFMRIFKEYGSDQMPLFGESKSQTFGNLSYSKAVALFAVPQEERETFMTENNVGEISVSELKRLIAERESELDAARKNEKKALEGMELLRGELSEARREAQEATVSGEEIENIRLAAFEEAEEKAKASAAAEIDAIRQAAEREKNGIAQKAAKLNLELKKEKAAADAKIKKAVEAQRERIAELERRIAEAAAADKGIADELARERERAAGLEKRLRLSDGDATKFTVYFEELQSCFNKLAGLIVRIEQSDEGKAAKLKGAVATVLGGMLERVQ